MFKELSKETQTLFIKEYFLFFLEDIFDAEDISKRFELISFIKDKEVRDSVIETIMSLSWDECTCGTCIDIYKLEKIIDDNGNFDVTSSLLPIYQEVVQRLNSGFEPKFSSPKEPKYNTREDLMKLAGNQLFQ